MAEGDMVAYNVFKKNLLEGIHNLANAGNTIKVTLHTGYTPDIDTHVIWATAGVSSTEYGTGVGYTAGGKTLAGQAVAQDSPNDRATWDGDNVAWTALGPLTPNTPSHAIIWNDTPAAPADPLIAYIVLGVTATNGGDYTLAFSTVPSAILTLT
jgi:hypothetical protein